jgi:hypothetical protein
MEVELWHERLDRRTLALEQGQDGTHKSDLPSRTRGRRTVIVPQLSASWRGLP